MKDLSTPDVLGPGYVIGPWRIEGYAGRGSYGRVFRARLNGYPDSPLVALKVAVFAFDPRFMREASLLSRVHNPSIPRLIDRGWWVAGPQVSYPYLALEWIHGRSLYEWARVHQATSRQVLRVLEQVAGALAVLHQVDALHRDTKGDNLLVDAQGRAVLMDYGSSTWAGAPPLTESLMPPNTPEYRSPEAQRFAWEHWRTNGVSYQARPADDVYALGVALYRLVTREYPPPEAEPEELTARRLPTQALNQQAAPELSALIEQLLADAPDSRGSAGEIADAAKAAAEHVGPLADVALFPEERIEAWPMLFPVRAEPPAHPRPWRLGLAAAAAVFLTMAGSWWLSHGSSKQQPAAEAPDVGPTGLGEAELRAHNAVQDAASSAKTIALQVPEKPLPNQRRAPCDRGEVVLQKGCWIPWTTRSPPCGERAYEWKGDCYLPSLEEARVPTTENPQ